MPDQFSPTFQHEALEADLHRLAEEVQKHREMPEAKNLSDAEIIKKSMQVFVPTNPVQDDAGVSQTSGSPLPDYVQKAPAETKLEVEYLLDLAFHKGIQNAFQEAKKSNPYVFDAFHDALAGKLYPELQKRGLVK